MNRNNKSKDEKTASGLGSQINYSIQGPIPHKKLIAGDISRKIPVPLKDGRTTIYVSPGADLEAVKEKFEKRILVW